MRNVTILFLIFLCFSLWGQQEKNLIPYEQFRLKNGLTVILAPNTETSLVSVQLFYRVGSADESSKELGISHFLEHMMFKTSQNLKAGEYSLNIKSLGGYDNASTTFDYTTYYHVLPFNELETGLKLEAERMARLTFDPKEVDSERQVIIEERHNRYENSPFGYLWEKANEIFFKGHAYGNPIIGYEETLKKIGAEELKQYYRRFYSPSNSLLIVAGKFSSEQVKNQINDFFGSIKAFPVQAKKQASPGLSGISGNYVFEKKIQSPYGMMMIRIPSAESDYSPSLLVLDSILFQGQNSVLNQELVMKQRICFQVGGGSYLRRQESSYLIYYIPAPGQGPQSIIPAIRKELESLKGRLDLETLLEKAKLLILTDFYQDLQKVDGLGRTLGWGYILGSPDFGLKLYEKVKNLSIQDLSRTIDFLLKQSSADFFLQPPKN